MDIKQRITRYNELKAQISELEFQKKEISKSFKTGLEALAIDVMRVNVSGDVYQLKLSSRATHSCQWEMFKSLYPSLYEEFVTDGTSEYVDVRKINPNRDTDENVTTVE